MAILRSSQTRWISSWRFYKHEAEHVDENAGENEPLHEHFEKNLRAMGESFCLLFALISTINRPRKNSVTKNPGL